MSMFTSRTARVPSNHKRKYNISAHALARFRERVDDEFRHRDDQDLMNLLDEKLRATEKTWDVRDPRAPGEITKLYAISTRKVGTFYAVVRHDTAVTVLDEDMAVKNFNGQWEPILNLPFQGLKNFVLPPAHAAPITAKATPVPIALVPPVVTDEPPDTARQIAEESFAAAWRRKEAAVIAFEAAERELDDAETAFDVAALALFRTTTGKKL
jgi:hypothetical protein